MKKTIDILEVITALNVGGAERVVLELSKEIKNNIAIAYILNRTKLLEQYSDLKVPLFFLGCKSSELGSFFLSIYTLFKLVKKYNVKVLHAHMFHSLVICVLVKILVWNVKIVFTSHSFNINSKLRCFFIYSTKMFRKADIVFSYKQHVKLNYNPLIISNGVSLNKLEIESINGKYIFFTAGRLHKPKNHKYLIESFANVNDKTSELWIAGDGYLKHELKDLIKEKGLENRVFLLGVRKDVQVLMKQAHFFVLSSSWEGMPMVILEAGMAGIPIISTNVGAVGELLTKDYGYLVTVDSSQLAATMNYVVQNYDEASIKGKAFQKYVIHNYSTDVMVAKHLELYSKYLENE